MKILRPEVLADLVSDRPGMHGVTDLLDDITLSSFNITGDELDYICENASDEEMSDFMVIASKQASFADKRKALLVRNKYLSLIQNQES